MPTHKTPKATPTVPDAHIGEPAGDAEAGEIFCTGLPPDPEVPAPGSNLDGISFHPGASKKPNGYRPSLYVRFPDGTHVRLTVPSEPSTTLEEALANADAYRARIIAADILPPRPERFGWSSDEGLTLRSPDGTPLED